MTNQDWEIKKIAIENLVLWDGNARFPDYLLGEKEEELIQTLIDKYNIEILVRSIVKDFNLPQIEKIVVLERNKKYIVLEGNRRVAAYKCLIKPSRLQDDTLRRKFEVFKSEIGINKKYKIEAVVTKSKKEGMRYVERKHYYKNNEEGWEQPERDRYIKRARKRVKADKLSDKEAKSIFYANVAEKIKEVDLPEEITQRVLRKGFVSIFYRIVDSDAGRRKLKYERSVDNNLTIGDEREFLLLLKIIIFNTVKKQQFNGKKLNTRTLNKDKDIIKYLDSISASDVGEVDRLLELEKISGAKKAKSAIRQGTGKKIKETKFFSLIDPKIFLPNIESDKIVAIFQELQRINVKDNPHAVSLLVRALTEISVKEYLITKKEKFNKDGYLISQRGKIKKSLKEKMDYINANYIKDPELKKVITLLNQNLLTFNLNQVVHNIHFLATESNIKDLWKNLSKFFYFLVQNLEVKK